MKPNFYRYFLVALLLTFIWGGVAYADKVLFFTPTRVFLSDEDKVELLYVTNLSEISRAYKISFQDLVMTYDGVTTPVDSFEYSAKRLLRFIPREFVLKPGERQTIRVMSKILPDLKDGEYHTHVRFLEDVSQRHKINPPKSGKTATISAPLAYEALIPVVISHGAINRTIGVKDAKLVKDPKTGEWVVKMILTREGNAQATAYVDTIYVAPDGTETIATPRRTVYLYREISERVKDIPFVLAKTVKPGGTVKVSVYDNPENTASIVKEINFSMPK